MHKHDRTHSKVHIGIRLFALLLCLCVIVSTFSSVLPKSVFALDEDMLGWPILNTTSEDNRPSAQSYGEGVMYLDEFLKKYPDAKVKGRDESMPIAVGDFGDRIDPDWFEAVVNVMGKLKSVGPLTIRPTNRKDDGLLTLWDAQDQMNNLYIIYPEEKADDGSIGRYTTVDTWPISGLMNWTQYGEYQYVDGGNYPELSTTYGTRDINYGITSAYLGYSRVYNVGVISVKTEVEEEVDGSLQKVTKDIDYLWVSIDETGDDDSVIVLPDTKPNHQVSLHYGPREYPVSYDIVVNDLYLGKKEDGTSGTVNKKLSQMTVDEIRAVWGEAVIPSTITTAEAAREAAMKKVFGTIGDDADTMTKNQTASFNVTIPYGTYGDVSYVTAVNSKEIALYPSEYGYGKNPLGTEPDYIFGTESSENPDDFWTEINTDDGGPDRFSVSERYTLGKTGIANAAVTVTVTITRRHDTYDYTTDTDDEGNEYVDWENTGYQTHFEPLGTYHFNFIRTGNDYIYKKWLNAGYAAPSINNDGTFNTKIMLSSYFGSDNNAENDRLLTLEINEQEINLPHGGTQNAYDESEDGVPAETTLDDGSVVKVWYLYLDTNTTRDNFRNWCNSGAGHTKYPKLTGVNDTRYTGVYIIEVKGAKRDTTITNIEVASDTSNVGKIIVEKATGVNVQLWYYKQYSSRGNSQDLRWWESKGVGGWSRIRYHRTIDQHGKFRFYDSASRGVPGGGSAGSSNIFQIYNVRVSLKEGYYWPGTDRYGVLRDITTGNETTVIRDQNIASYEYHDRTNKELTIDEVELNKYSSGLVGSGNEYNSLKPSNVIISSSIDSDTRSSFTFKPDGTYSAVIKRTTNNTRRTYTGTWSYDFNTGTLTINYPTSGNYDYPRDVTQVTATGNPLVFTYMRRNNSGSYVYETEFSLAPEELPLAEYYQNWYYASLATLPSLRTRAERNTYLRFEAIPRTYELRYLSGVSKDNNSNTIGIGPNSEYDQYGFNTIFHLKTNTMPYYDNDDNVDPYYIDTTGYSKADAKELESSFHIFKGMPEDNGSIVDNDQIFYKFQYWVLTDKDGNPVDEEGNEIKCVGTGEDGKVTKSDIAAWQAQFIKFYPSDSISLSSFDDIVEATGKSTNGEDVVTFDIVNQKFIFYLTACWTADASKPYTSFVTVNTRADISDGGLNDAAETKLAEWFGGSWYLIDDRKEDEDQDSDSKDGRIKAAYSRTSYLDESAAGGDTVNGVTVTVDKDIMTELMGQYAVELNNPKYWWYTLDDSQNGWDDKHNIDPGTYTWLRIPDKQEVPVWFLYNLGGVTIETAIDGYDQPVAYKLTLTLPTYEGNDRTPIEFNEDGSVKEWDATDYRYTAAIESEFFLDNGHGIPVDKTDDGTEPTYSVPVNLTTATHDAEAYERVGFVESKNDVDVSSYVSNSDVLNNITRNTDSTSADLVLEQDEDDSNSYYAVIYLGKGDSINIPELPAGTTYTLALYDAGYREAYDGYYMEAVAKNEGKTQTAWKNTTGLDTTRDGNHTESKKYFDVVLDEKNANDQYIGFTSADYELKDGSGNVTATYKGINAYDTQYINVTTKGTYTLYLDQATIDQAKVEPGEDVDEEELIINDQLEVQNFDYLSYKNTARNLTNSPQTLEISFDVVTHRIGNSDLDKRYLSIVRINSEDVSIVQEGMSEEDKAGQTETSDEMEIVFKDGTKGTAVWTYSYDTHKIVYRVTNVPSGETIDLTVRTTVPAVNTVTSYTGNAELNPLTDTKAGKFTDNEVNAVVFSNWLRIAAFIGPDTSNTEDENAYKLTNKDQNEVFKYKVTLDDGEDYEIINTELHYMIFNKSDAFGTEHDESEQKTVSTSGTTEDDTLYVNDSDGSYYFFVKLKHDQRVVIYNLFREGVDDQVEEEPSDEPQTADLEEDQPETSEPIKGVNYTVVWIPEKQGEGGRDEDQNKDYFAYSYGINGYKEDGTEKRTENRTDWTYTGEITEGVDMVVYRYMVSDDLEITKEVTGDNAETGKSFNFTVILTVPNGIEALLKEYTLVYKNSDGSQSEQKITLNPVDNEDSTAPKSYTCTITLTNGQTAIIQGLPAGTGYTVTEADYSSDGYVTSVKVPDKTDSKETWGNGEPSADGRSITGSILTDFVDEDDPKADDVLVDNKVLFTNNKTVNNVVISKTVESDDPDILATSFTFTVTVIAPTGYNPSKYDHDSDPSTEAVPAFAYTGGVISGVSDVTSANSGYIAWNAEKSAYIGTITLKHGQQITFENLPYGTVVSAKEDVNGAFTSVVTDNYDPTTDGSVAVMQGKNNFAEGYIIAFVNTPVAHDGDLTIYKIVPNYVSGYDPEEFTFTVKLTDSKGAPLTDDFSGLTKTANAGYYTATVNRLTEISRADADVRAIFTDLKAGTYIGWVLISDVPYGTDYEIIENGTEDAGWKYEAPDWNWKLNAEASAPTDTHKGTIASDNTMAVCTNTKTGILILDKVVSGSTGNRTDTFTFTVTLEDADKNPLKGKYAAVHNGDDSITELEFNESGEAKVQLKHGQSITIKGLPYGVGYKIEETASDWYMSSIITNDSDAKSNESTRTVSGYVEVQEVTVDSDDNGDITKTKTWNAATTVSYNNRRDGTIPTNATIVAFWPIPLFMMAIFGVVMILVHRRRGKAVE